MVSTSLKPSNFTHRLRRTQANKLKAGQVPLPGQPSLSNNDEFIALMEDAYTRRDFIYGLEKATGREVVEIKKVNYHGRDYIGTRYQSNPAGKIIFSLCSVAKNGLMVAFKFCFDRDDFKVVADNNGESIIDTFLENVIFI